MCGYLWEILFFSFGFYLIRTSANTKGRGNGQNLPVKVD